MEKIILVILILCSVAFADEFIPEMELGDNWTVRREIGGIENLENNKNKIQFWRYEVVNNIEFNEEEYLVIFATSKDVNASIKIVVNKEDFNVKEISHTNKNKTINLDMGEINAPVIDINILARLYDLPAFPISDPNSADKNTYTLPNGKKRTRKKFKRSYSGRGEVASSELIWQETDNISRKDIMKYSGKTGDHISKITGDGYLINIRGEKRRIKQIWVKSVPWWIYNESNYEKDYLIGYNSVNAD